MIHSFGPQMPPLLAVLFVHLVMALALWKIAERLKEEPKWYAVVPVLNVLLLLKIARKPMWWLVLFLIPIVNLVALIIATMAVCERFGINKWWGLAAVISPINLVLYLYMAFNDKLTISTAAPASPPAAPMPPTAPLA